MEIQNWLALQGEQMANDLEQLCNINSGSSSLEGLQRVANWLVEYFEPLQAPATKITLPPYESVDDGGHKALLQTVPALRWDISRSTSPTKRRILLSIHFDTVYGPESPFQSCYRYQARNQLGKLEPRMRGPGVIDAKGGIVVLRWACLAAHKFLDLSKLDLTVVLTPDEEIGSPASLTLWQQIASEFDFAMLFEPTLSDGAWVSDRKGTGNFVVVVRGKSAHAGRNFQDGRNAVVLACRMALDMDGLNGVRNNVTINVGRIRGGDAVNVVPDLAVFRVNVRVNDMDDQRWLETSVQKLVHKYQAEFREYAVELFGGIHAAPKTVTPEVRQWMSRVEQVGASLGSEIRWRSSGGASDGNKLNALGLPNIDTFGPEGDLLHSDQEWIRLSSLPAKATIAAKLLEGLAT
jgi:glutamate carboxypeptidase